MDLMESFRTLRRHWILTSALLLLTLAGTAAAAIKLPWTYQSTAMIVLLNSNSASATDGGNPYLAFSSSLTNTAEVVSLDVTDPRTALALQARGYTEGYAITISSVTGGPVLQVAVTGHNPAAVEHTLYGVIGEVHTKLLDLQSGVTQRNLIKDQVVSVTTQPTHSVSKKAKPLVVLLALGLVLTFAIPQIVDGTISRRRRRQTAETSRGTRYLDDEEAAPSRPNGPVPARLARRGGLGGSAGYDLDADPQERLTREESRERVRLGRRR